MAVIKGSFCRSKKVISKHRKHIKKNGDYQHSLSFFNTIKSVGYLNFLKLKVRYIFHLNHYLALT